MNYNSIKNKEGNILITFIVDGVTTTIGMTPEECKKFLCKTNDVLNDAQSQEHLDFNTMMSYYDFTLDEVE